MGRVAARGYGCGAGEQEGRDPVAIWLDICHYGYVARKQVLVQLDDELVEELDRHAARLGVSRSELIRRAAGALLEAFAEAEAEREMVESYRRHPEDPSEFAAFERAALEAWPEP
ncbi:hypothetical protein HRbin12_00859 [bacterium HR12]|nr:hypothetical protein HRbin12_00859 [bacterium HR12]